MNALLLTLALSISDPSAGAEAHPVEAPRHAFRLGVECRDDARSARPHFAEAARRYRQFWERGERSANLAQSWARAEFLAGKLPEAIVAAHQGLRIAPQHVGLQWDLETFRDAVVPSANPTPGLTNRPPRLSGVRARISEWDLFWATAGATALVGIGLMRRFTCGGAWARMLAILGAAGLVGCASLSAKRDLEGREDRASPLWVLREDSLLRKGNGESHAARIEAPIPRGAEVRELAVRGGWIQVRLAGDSVGWLPEGALLPVP